MAVVSLSTFKEYLPELSGSTGADTELTNFLARVESAVARYIGFPGWTGDSGDANQNPVLDSTTYTLYVDGPTNYDRYTLQLPIAPIVSITSIHSDINRQYLASSLVDGSTYTFNSELGRVYLDPNTATNIFDDGYRSNKIILVAGYTSGTAPTDLVHAICVWASQLHRNKATQGKESISQSNSTVRISPKKMPEEVREYINYLRFPGVVL